MNRDREGDEMTVITEDQTTGGRAARTPEPRRGGPDRTDPDRRDPDRRDPDRKDRRPDPASAGDEGDGAVEVGGAPPWLVVALVAWGLVMLALAGWSFLRADRLADDRDDRRAAASVAGEFASATMSYDHRDLDGSLAAVTDLATAEYAETYQNAFFEELQPVVDELAARGRVHVRDVYVSDIGDGTATAVVSFDAVIRSTIGTRRLAGSYVRVDLVEEGGAWKADDLTFLATTQEGLDGPAGEAGATTPTTAPPG